MVWVRVGGGGWAWIRTRRRTYSDLRTATGYGSIAICEGRMHLSFVGRRARCLRGARAAAARRASRPLRRHDNERLPRRRIPPVILAPPHTPQLRVPRVLRTSLVVRVHRRPLLIGAAHCNPQMVPVAPRHVRPSSLRRNLHMRGHTPTPHGGEPPCQKQSRSHLLTHIKVSRRPVCMFGGDTSMLKMGFQELETPGSASKRAHCS